MASHPGAPVEGVEYPVILGDTFLQLSARKYFTLRYHQIKSAAIDTAVPGLLTQFGDKEVEVEFKNKEAEKPCVLYKGHHEQCKDLEYLVLFDGKSMKFERLTDSIKNLRHVRASESVRDRGSGETAARDAAGASQAVNDWVTTGRQEQGSQGSAPVSGDEDDLGEKASPILGAGARNAHRQTVETSAPAKRAKHGGAGAASQAVGLPAPPASVGHRQDHPVSPEPPRRTSLDIESDEVDVDDDDDDDDHDDGGAESEDVDIDHIDIGEEDAGLPRASAVPAVVIDPQDVTSASSSEDEDSSDDDSSDDDDTSSDDNA